jgi:hypothetical protein
VALALAKAHTSLKQAEGKFAAANDRVKQAKRNLNETVAERGGRRETGTQPAQHTGGPPRQWTGFQRRGSEISGLCVPMTSSTSCDQVIFVDHAIDVSVFSDTVLVEVDRFG